MKKSRQYNVVSKDLMVIRVELLDSTPVECTLSSESSGQECLDNVCQRFGIKQVGTGAADSREGLWTLGFRLGAALVILRSGCEVWSCGVELWGWTVSCEVGL